jgi:phospholipid:diacylglycerol acyltransferase
MPIRRRAKGNTAKGSNNGKSKQADIVKDKKDSLDENALSPEDILADSRSLSETPQPWYRKRIFHFALGLTIGLLAAFGVGSTPLAQSHISEFQDFVAMYIADMDIASKIPNSDLMDELFGNMTSYIKPVPASEQPFMPGLQAK